MSIAAVDVGGTRIKLGVFAGGQLVHVAAVPVKADETFPEMLGEVRAAVQRVLHDLGLPACSGVSISFPGIVDREQGRVLAVFGKYVDALGFDLPAWIQSHWDVPFVIDNDANLALYGEWRHGAGRGVENLVVVTLGTGFGTSAMIRGEIVPSRRLQSGGHVIIAIDGHRCLCGKRGCIEAEASTWAIPALAREKNMASPLLDEALIDYAAVFRWAQRGDRLACEMTDRSAQVWATGMALLTHAFDPARIVTGGGIMRAAEFLLPKIQAHFDRLIVDLGEPVKIVVAEHLDAAALWGGFARLREKITRPCET